eukprot:259727-Chlamydomonas_euryale.AAC.6
MSRGVDGDGRSVALREETIGLVLAVSSSVFIGASFIIKKRGLRLAGSSGLRAGATASISASICGRADARVCGTMACVVSEGRRAKLISKERTTCVVGEEARASSMHVDGVWAWCCMLHARGARAWGVAAACMVLHARGARAWGVAAACMTQACS